MSIDGHAIGLEGSQLIEKRRADATGDEQGAP